MSLDHCDDRSERDDELDGCAEREAVEQAEAFNDIVDPVLEIVATAMRRLVERKLINQTSPRFEHPVFGWQPTISIPAEHVVEQAAADVRGAFVAWAKDSFKAEVER